MPKTEFTKADIEQVAKLARLNLSDTKIVEFTKAIGEVLSYAAQVSDISENNVEVSGSDGYGDQFIKSPNKDTVREDLISECSKKSRQEILLDAPATLDNFIKVSQVLDKHKK